MRQSPLKAPRKLYPVMRSGPGSVVTHVVARPVDNTLVPVSGAALCGGAPAGTKAWVPAPNQLMEPTCTKCHERMAPEERKALQGKSA